MLIDLTSKIFGKLTVTSRAPNSKSRAARWVCECECGETVSVISASLIRGATRSCGCAIAQQARDRFTTHGKWRTRTYTSWDAMIQRCTNSNHPKWKFYGGRGIKVCDRWRDFSNFLSDVGDRPERTTLDRYPDMSGNYEPGNCRWANHIDQHSNTRSNRTVVFNGETLTIAELARRTGVYEQKLGNRIKRGWAIERAVIP